MARTVLNREITAASSYTVPAGKILIFAAFLSHANSSASCRVLIGGVPVAYLTRDVTNDEGSAKPLVAKAGDVLTVTSTGGNITYSISGFLYDV